MSLERIFLSRDEGTNREDFPSSSVCSFASLGTAMVPLTAIVFKMEKIWMLAYTQTWKMSLQICFSVIMHFFVHVPFFVMQNLWTQPLKKGNRERKIEMHCFLSRNTLLNSPLYFQVKLHFLVSDLQTAS